MGPELWPGTGGEWQAKIDEKDVIRQVETGEQRLGGAGRNKGKIALACPRPCSAPRQRLGAQRLPSSGRYWLPQYWGGWAPSLKILRRLKPLATPIPGAPGRGSQYWIRYTLVYRVCNNCQKLNHLMDPSREAVNRSNIECSCGKTAPPHSLNASIPS